MEKGLFMVKGIVMYGGELLAILAVFIVLFHAYQEGIKYVLLIIVSIIGLGYVGQMIGVPDFLMGPFMSLYFLFYFFTKYEKESKGFLMGMYIVGIVLEMIGKNMPA